MGSVIHAGCIEIPRALIPGTRAPAPKAPAAPNDPGAAAAEPLFFSGLDLEANGTIPANGDAVKYKTAFLNALGGYVPALLVYHWQIPLFVGLPAALVVTVVVGAVHDGEDLVRLMMTFGLGVRTVRDFAILAPDADAFDAFEE